MKNAIIVSVEVTDRMAAELADANQELLRDLLQRGLRDRHIEQALSRYQQGEISFAAAAELAGVSQPEFARAAYARGMEPPLDGDLLAEEL